MINDDTIKLLRECNSGVKMGVISLDDVLGHVRDENLEKRLSACKQAHESLGDETHDLLNEYHDTGKEPNPMAKGMSWMKTNVQLAMNDSDKTIADLITDGWLPPCAHICKIRLHFQFFKLNLESKTAL